MMNAAQRDGVVQGGIRLGRVGASAGLTIDRGGALNALTPAMLARLAQCYPQLARDPNLYVVVLKSADPRAFSAGGDVRAMSAVARRDLSQACHDLAAEYRLNWLHECFSKPTVALIDGLVMGSGVGISAYATHRVAGRGYRFAMPETAIGFFPDVGMAHALARMPHQIGTYLGLTGATIGRADAYALGLVTHCVERELFGEVEARLADAWPVDPELDSRHVDPGPGDLMARSATLAQCFAPDSIEEILTRLDAVTGADRDFARVTRADLETRAPLALKVTLRHLRRSASLDLRQTLEADYRLACRFLAGPDFHEGVRAALIDKDHAPRWMPAHFADVTAHMLDDMFAHLPPERELNLPLRQDMQSMRV